jgi:uncharacterized SAM-binding protein YcdF (DUF218 family)
MEFILKILAIPLYPLGLSICSIGTGIILEHRKYRWGKTIILSGLVLLYLMSTSVVSRLLLRPLEAPYAESGTLPNDCSAIVVLGGGGKPMSSPDENPELNEAGDRLLHAARLYKRGIAPRIVTTGGYSVGGFHQKITEGAQNALVLREMGVDSSAILIEAKSLTTADHGPYIAAIFDSLNLQKKIVLVTSAAHMYRSIRVFKKHGFTIYPSATDFKTNRYFINGSSDFFPSVGALDAATAAMHEYYGVVGYVVLGKM